MSATMPTHRTMVARVLRAFDDDGTQSVARHWGDGITLERVRDGRRVCSTSADWSDTEAAAAYAVTHYGPGTTIRL